VNDNVYKFNFPRDYGVSTTFNVADLSPYLEDDHLANLRANSPQQGEGDGRPSMGPHQKPQGTLEGLSSNSNVEEEVQTLLSQLTILPGLREMHKLGFIYLLERDPNRENSCTPLPHLAYVLSFPIS